MEIILIYLKHKMPWLWGFIEMVNGMVFNFFYGHKLIPTTLKYLPYKHKDDFIYKRLEHINLKDLSDLLSHQKDMKFFQPHSFDLKTIKRLFNNPSFLMMGVFKNDKIVGYFFLRFFVNKKAFIGRMVTLEYQRLGLAKEMSKIMYGITWDMGFRCLTTISEDNKAIFDLHKKESNVRFLKNLSNKYHLVEILPDKPRVI